MNLKKMFYIIGSMHSLTKAYSLLVVFKQHKLICEMRFTYIYIFLFNEFQCVCVCGGGGGVLTPKYYGQT